MIRIPLQNAKSYGSLFKDAFFAWNEDNATRMGAALAYYTLFSLAPLLIIAIAIAGLFFGQDAAQGQIVGQIEGMVGQQGAQAIQSLLENVNKPNAGTTATIISFIVLFFGASGVLVELRAALCTIWQVAPAQESGFLTLVWDRIFAFGVVLGIGLLLLSLLIVSAALAALSKFLNHLIPIPVFLLQIADFVISFGVITLLFAMIYKVLPNSRTAWSDVWIGAAVASLLFTIGKILIGLYLGRSGIASTYGAAGSLVILLIWIYYSAQILYFGAEFTRVYAQRFGSLRMTRGQDGPPPTVVTHSK